MRKSEIIKNLRKNQERLGEIINGFEALNTEDQTVERHAQNKITFTMFELMDNIGKVEVAIYNYLKRRGWK